MRHISYIGSHKRIGIIYLLGIFLIAGIAAGAVYQAKCSPAASELIHQYAAPVYEDLSLSGYFLGGFIQTALLLICTYILGFFALGQPFAPALLVFKGFGIGASAAMLYASFGAKAFVSVLILIVPKAVLSSLVLILGTRELIRASTFTLSCWFGDKFSDKQEQNFRMYCIKFLVLILIAMIISASDAAVNLLFTRLS